MSYFNNLQKKIEKRLLNVPKRIRFIMATVILTVFILFSTFFSFDKAIIFIPIFAVLVYLLTFFSILEGIEKIERIMFFIMPVVFSIAFYLFYFLFPVRWLTRVPFVITYAFSLYALLLTANIFNIGAQKSLQLFRAAFSVNYFYQIFIIFLLLNVFFSFRLSFILNALSVFLIIFPLSLQFLWSIKPKIYLEKNIILLALLLGLILSEISLTFSFIPIKTSIFALFLATSYYSLAGLIYAHLDDRLFKETIREYIVVLGFVFLIVILTISW